MPPPTRTGVITPTDEEALEDIGAQNYEIELTKDAAGKPIRLKNLIQKTYVDSVKQHDIVFGIGPAGTGKTFLAVVMAVQALRNGQVKRIILTRPAVEAGESLGFLPYLVICKKKLIHIYVLFMTRFFRVWVKQRLSE